MAEQVRSYELVIATGSSRTAPVIMDVSFPPFRVESIEVDVPPGPNGNIGFQIASSRQQVIPWNAGQWIVPNGQHFIWANDKYPTSGDWQLIVYNQGQYAHTIWVRFNVDPVGVGQADQAVTVSLADLGGGGGGSGDVVGTSAPSSPATPVTTMTGLQVANVYPPALGGGFVGAPHIGGQP